MTPPLGSTPTAIRRDFTATTGESASAPRNGTRLLTDSAAWSSPSRTTCSMSVSRRAFTCSIREPGPDSCCLHAGHHLGSRRVAPQAHPRAKTKPWFRCHLISFRRFSRQRAYRPIAHLPGPHLTRSQPRLFLRRSRPRSLAKAPVGGLKPPPARRLRRSRTPPSTRTAPEPGLTEPGLRSCSQGLQPTQHEAV